MSWTRHWKQYGLAYLLLAPNLLIFGLFRHFPALYGFVMSFFSWSVIGKPKFLGTANYAKLLQDEIFWKALGVTVKYTLLTVLPGMVVSLALALLVNRTWRGIKLFRTIYYVPVITSTVIVAILWRWFYDSGANYFMNLLGLPEVMWLADPRFALPSLAIMSIWKNAGYNMVLFLAGLQSIPSELYESASIDGAGGGRQFWHVTLPLLKPITMFILIMSMISSFQVFDQAYLMTRGGPFFATTTLVYYVYYNAFEIYQMGYASAVAYVLFIVLLIASIIQRKAFGLGENTY
ncbi:MAG: sugar ABC transporter permease [Firmicutes bacterium]|nr:sugar ABC transporter permease [Bacillota bacterium]